MQNQYCRKLLLVSGQDKKIFLQGLITNDINLLDSQPIIYSALLTPKGRYIVDFFIINYENDYLLDVDAEQYDLLLAKLKFYKLVSKVHFTEIDNIKVYLARVNISNTVSYPDPRIANLAYRVYTQDTVEPSSLLSAHEYKTLRFKLAILEGVEIPADILLIEYGFDELNGISYTKGCYVGQEITNSAKNLLAIRKRTIAFNILNYEHEVELINNAAILDATDNKIGTVVAISGDLGVAIVKMSTIINGGNFYCLGHKLILTVPSHIKHYTLD